MKSTIKHAGVKTGKLLSMGFEYMGYKFSFTIILWLDIASTVFALIHTPLENPSKILMDAFTDDKYSIIL